MNICIYGAGAIGSLMGALLARSGNTVSVVARGETVSILNQRGLRASLPEGDVIVPVRATARSEDIGPQDIVVVAVKAQSLAGIAPRIVPLITPHTIVIPAMNGVPWWFFNGFGGIYAGSRLKSVDSDGIIGRFIPDQSLVGCVVHFASSCPESGLSRQNSPKRPIIIGEPSGGVSDRLHMLSRLFSQSGLETTISERIQADIWYKLWGNMTMNPLSAITGATTDRLLDDPLVKRFCLDIMSEAALIGERIGCPIAQSGDERIALTRKLGPIKTSMLQDAEAGKSLELDALVNAVREIGALVGVPTPATDTLFGLVRAFAQNHGLYPM